MKKFFFSTAIALFILMFCNQNIFAQSDKPYAEGPLWEVQFIHTKPGMTELYLKNLANGWIKEMRAAKDAGYIMDYKVFESQPASENDWDLMLMYEIKNYAMLDGATEKMEALSKKVFGQDDNTMHTQAVSRNDLRVLQGGKLTQELDFK
ncbi:MAG TPA: hypothetical protein VFU62_11270 [Hanamia sp.]|jgi:hypothetical protein|nr:hypothetical protein [Hanamia sp.]